MSEPNAGRRVVAISGATRGLGRAFAFGLAARGAAVIVNGRDETGAETVAAEIRAAGGEALAVAGPIQQEAVADAMVAAAVERFGRVDLVVNNAGLTRDRTLAKMSAEDFDEVVAVHLRGAWALSRAGVRAMRDAGTGGGIVNVVSGSALFGLVGQSNYAAAKGALIAMTRALSLELARDAIRVNALYPVALTDMTQPVVDLMTARGGDASQVPFGSPDDVVPLVAFLLSERSRDVTGQVLHFDGRELTVWTHPARGLRDAPRHLGRRRRRGLLRPGAVPARAAEPGPLGNRDPRWPAGGPGEQIPPRVEGARGARGA